MLTRKVFNGSVNEALPFLLHLHKVILGHQ